MKFKIYRIDWLKGTASPKHVLWGRLPAETTVEVDVDGYGWFETEAEHRQYVRDEIGRELVRRFGWDVGGFWYDPE